MFLANLTSSATQKHDSRRTKSNRLSLWSRLCLLVCLALPIIAHAGVTASVDRNTINEGDTFTLTLTVSGDNHAQPDLSGLKQDFDVLGTGQNSQIQIINGSVSSSRSWSVTLSPKRTGKLTIPPVQVGSDRSNALSVTVLPASASSGGSQNQADVFVQVSVKPDHKSYVQAQLLYTVRLYYAEALQQGTLSDPTADNAVIQKLGKDNHFSTMHNGRQYQVIERHYAIFPQQSGTLKIDGVVFDGQVNDPSQQTGDPFFDSFNPPTRHVHLRARTLALQVTTQPASYTGTNWLPAENIRLQSTWSPNNPTFRVGEPVTRSLIIQARGLSSSQLPDLTIPSQPGLKLYPDQAQTSDKADGDTLHATRTQKIAMIPTRAGKLTLPAIHLIWWDTKTHQQRTSSLPAETIHVLPAAASSTTGIPAAPVQQSSATQIQPKPATPGATTAGNTTPQHKPVVTSEDTHLVTLLIILASFFALAWLITLLFLWQRRKPRAQAQQPQKETETRITEQACLKQLALACRLNDPDATRHALLEWAKIHWPDNPPLSLGALANRLQDPVMQRQLSELDKALYTGNVTNWQAGQLLTALNACLRQPHTTNATHARVLEPLHPQQRRTG